MQSRGTKRSRFSPPANRKERLLRRLAMTKKHAALAMTKNAVARNEASSVFYRWQTAKTEIASQARNDKKCSRGVRSDLAFLPMANSEKRDCRAALAMTKNAVARNVAISVFYRWRTAKERLLRRLAMTIRFAALAPPVTLHAAIR